MKDSVLILDDDIDALLIINLHFENAGVNVLQFSDPKVAFEALQELIGTDKEPKLIATDIRMPLLDGNEFTRKVRDAGYSGIIVAFTAGATGEGKRESNQSGIDRYFSKTTLNGELIAALVAEYCK